MSEVELSECGNRAASSCPMSCPRHSARGPLLAVAGWLAAAVAALAVAAVPYDIGESLCGVWGCFPPLPALVAMHLLWCVLLAAIVHAVSGLRTSLLRPFGTILFLMAATATVLVLGNDLKHWLELSDRYRSFWLERIGYTLATNTDIPLLESLTAGIVCMLLSRTNNRAIQGV